MTSVTVAPSCWMDVVWRAAEKVTWLARTRECVKVGGNARGRHKSTVDGPYSYSGLFL